MKTDAMPGGHLRMCERTTHPNSLHPCDCGQAEPAPSVQFTGTCGACGQLVADGRAVHGACEPAPQAERAPGKRATWKHCLMPQRKPRVTVKRFAADLKERLSRVAVAFSEPGQEQVVIGIVYAKAIIDTALTDYDTRDAGDFFPAAPLPQVKPDPDATASQVESACDALSADGSRCALYIGHSGWHTNGSTKWRLAEAVFQPDPDATAHEPREVDAQAESACGLTATAVADACASLGITTTSGPLGMHIGTTGWRLSRGSGVAGHAGSWWLRIIANVYDPKAPDAVAAPIGPLTTMAGLKDALMKKWPTQTENHLAAQSTPSQSDPDAAVRAIAERWGNERLLSPKERYEMIAAKAFAAGRALGRDGVTALLVDANDALAMAIHVLMRPVTIEVDAEVHGARMACMRAQDAIARRGKAPK